jgi:hypothetical protein
MDGADEDKRLRGGDRRTVGSGRQGGRDAGSATGGQQTGLVWRSQRRARRSWRSGGTGAEAEVRQEGRDWSHDRGPSQNRDPNLESAVRSQLPLLGRRHSLVSSTNCVTDAFC